MFEYLQEVQVKTVGIPAEFGGALGGVISAVTKSGGNTFRGEGHYYFSGSALSAPAREAARALACRRPDRRLLSRTTSRPDNRHEIGGSLGGPIVRDRLFFFGSYLAAVSSAGPTSINSSNGTRPGDIVEQNRRS